MLGKRRLARPIATEDAEKLAILDVQIDAVERFRSAVVAK